MTPNTAAVQAAGHTCQRRPRSSVESKPWKLALTDLAVTSPAFMEDAGVKYGCRHGRRDGRSDAEAGATKNALDIVDIHGPSADGTTKTGNVKWSIWTRDQTMPADGR